MLSKAVKALVCLLDQLIYSKQVSNIYKRCISVCYSISNQEFERTYKLQRFAKFTVNIEVGSSSQILTLSRKIQPKIVSTM